MNQSARKPNRGAAGNRSRAAVAAVLALIASLTVWQVAATPAAANTRVNQDPPGLEQNTCGITILPGGGAGVPPVLIAAYNEDPWNFNGIGTSFSVDGGLTWVDSATPVLPVFQNNLDPSVATDGVGAVYAGMASYDFLPPNNMNAGVYVSLSLDGGVNFTPANPVAVYLGPPGANPWPSKPKVDADSYGAAGSPFAGNTYVIWEEDLPTTGWFQGPSEAAFSFSPDQGVTWSPILRINDNWNQDLVLWPDIDVGADGRVAAVWTDSPFWMQHQGTVMFDQSLDGGATFGQDVPVTSYWAVPQMLTDAAGAPSYTALSYAVDAVDPGNPLRIGVVYAADPDNGPAAEGKADTGDNLPGQYDAWLLNPFSGRSNIAESGTYIHTCWIENRGTVPDVYYNRASMGAGFPPAWDNPDQMISTQPWPDHKGSNNANIVCNYNTVHAAWDEWVGVDFTHLIYYNGSQDDGATWLPSAVPLDTHYRTCYEPWVTVDGMNHVCVAWLEDQQDGVDTDIWVNYSTDSGATWQPSEIQVPTTFRAFDHDIHSFHDYVLGVHYVFLVWAEQTASGGSIIRFSRSLDSGATWSAPVRLDSSPQGQEFAYGPKICGEWNDLYVCWQDQRFGIEDVFTNWSTSAGASWNGEIQIDTSGSRDYMSQIACGQGNVYVAYESDRNAPGANEDIIVNFSVGSGANWQGERRIDTGSPPGARHSVYPRLAVSGADGQPTPYVVWADDRNGTVPFSGWDVYSNFSTDGGFTWPLDFRVDVGDQPGRNDSLTPHITGYNICYAWRDLRNGGVGDVYANVYAWGPDEGDVFYTESLDGGATWLNPPLRVNDDIGTNDQTHPWLDIKPNGTVDVVWYDKRNCPLDQNPEVYFAALLPGTTAFTPNQPVSNQPVVQPLPGFWIGDYIGVAVDATDAHVVWADNRREGLLFDAWYAVQQNPGVIRTGACCRTSQTCYNVTAAECQAMNGTYMGDDTTCEETDCHASAAGEPGGLPDGRWALLRSNAPNPFNPGTTIHYELGRALPVRLAIYDSAGRLVRELYRSPLQNGGEHSVYWNGRDDGGRSVAAGVYFCRLNAGGDVSSIRMALIK